MRILGLLMLLAMLQPAYSADQHHKAVHKAVVHKKPTWFCECHNYNPDMLMFADDH